MRHAVCATKGNFMLPGDLGRTSFDPYHDSPDIHQAKRLQFLGNGPGGRQHRRPTDPSAVITLSLPPSLGFGVTTDPALAVVAVGVTVQFVVTDVSTVP